MTIDPVKFSIPISGMWFCSRTRDRDGVFAMYALDGGAEMVCVCRKRKLKDQDAPWYVAINYCGVSGRFEDGIYDFVEARKAMDAVELIFADRHPRLLFDFTDWESISTTHAGATRNEFYYNDPESLCQRLRNRADQSEYPCHFDVDAWIAEHMNGGDESNE